MEFITLRVLILRLYSYFIIKKLERTTENLLQIVNNHDYLDSDDLPNKVAFKIRYRSYVYLFWIIIIVYFICTICKFIFTSTIYKIL